MGRELPDSALLTTATEPRLQLDVFPYVNELAELNSDMLSNWLTYIMDKETLTSAQLINRIHQLGKAEHNRWNTFHIMNNWRYGQEKNEALKIHDCLLDWEQLVKKKADTIKYDYKNIYHIAEYSLLGDKRGDY